MDIVEKVKEIIDKKHISSNGSCGTTLPSVATEIGVSYNDLKPVLNELYQQKYFILKEGINGKMIFKKVKKMA